MSDAESTKKPATPAALTEDEARNLAGHAGADNYFAPPRDGYPRVSTCVEGELRSGHVANLVTTEVDAPNQETVLRFGCYYDPNMGEDVETAIRLSREAVSWLLENLRPAPIDDDDDDAKLGDDEA